MKENLGVAKILAQTVAMADIDVLPLGPGRGDLASLEPIADSMSSGLLKGRCMRMETDDTALASAMGAAMTGRRSFTLMASDGLLASAHILHWMARSRLPVVIAHIATSPSPPLSFLPEQSASFSLKDSGCLQLYPLDLQELMDLSIMAFRISEKTLLPVILVIDPDLIEQSLAAAPLTSSAVSSFLPPFSYPYTLDTKAPATYGNPLPKGNHLLHLKLSQDIALEVPGQIQDIFSEFKKQFDRSYDFADIDFSASNIPETLVITAGSRGTKEARSLCEQYRGSGKSYGHLAIRCFHPFPTNIVREFASSVRRIIVLEQSVSPGSRSILSREIANALTGLQNPPELSSFLVGMGGNKITTESLDHILIHGKTNKDSTLPVWTDPDGDEEGNPWQVLSEE